MTLAVSVVIPAYQEGEAIMPVLDRIFEAVESTCEVLVVVDFEERLHGAGAGRVLSHGAAADHAGQHVWPRTGRTRSATASTTRSTARSW